MILLSIPLIAGALLLIAIIIFGSLLYYTLKNGIGPMPTAPKIKKHLVGLLPTPEEGTIYELGSGWGTLAFALAKKFPNYRVIAFENSLIPYYMSKFLNCFHGCRNIEFHRGDFFKDSLKDATLVVCYLYPRAMTKLEAKFRNELQPNCLIASHTFALPHVKPLKMEEAKDFYHTKIYLYSWKQKVPKNDQELELEQKPSLS